MTSNTKVQQWLELHNLIPKESFPAALRRMSREYQKANNIRKLDEVYQKIGVRKEYIYYWENHPYGAQTKKF